MSKIEIRPISLDEYLPDRCMGSEPFDPSEVQRSRGCTSLSEVANLGTDLETFYQQSIERYGGCGFVAWDGNLVVGHITFFSDEVARQVRFWGWGEEDLPVTHALVINCISVATNPKYRRIGIGTRFVQSAMDWARENSWPRLEVHIVPTGLGLSAPTWRSEQKGARPFWEQLGFRVVRISGREETLACCFAWAKGYYGKKFDTEEEVVRWDPDWEVTWLKYSMAFELE